MDEHERNVRSLAERIARGRTVAVVASTAGRTAPVVVAHGGPATKGAVAVDMLFEIGSITKTFTGLLLADAVQRKELTFGQPAGELIGCRLGSQSDGPVTLLDLALHTSGLPRSTSKWRDLTDPDPYSAFSTMNLREATSAIRLRSIGKVRYSNLGYALLGQALASALGTPWEELISERILAPLSLARTFPRTPRSDHERATGWRWGRYPARSWNLDGYAPAGSMWSTAPDMLRFAQLLCSQDPHPLSEAMALATATRVRSSRQAQVAIGLNVLERDDGEVWWHNGATSGFRSFFAVMPDTGRTVVVLHNSFTLRGPDLRALTFLRA